MFSSLTVSTHKDFAFNLFYIFIYLCMHCYSMTQRWQLHNKRSSGYDVAYVCVHIRICSCVMLNGGWASKAALRQTEITDSMFEEKIVLETRTRTCLKMSLHDLLQPAPILSSMNWWRAALPKSPRLWRRSTSPSCPTSLRYESPVQPCMVVVQWCTGPVNVLDASSNSVKFLHMNMLNRWGKGLSHDVPNTTCLNAEWMLEKSLRILIASHLKLAAKY